MVDGLQGVCMDVGGGGDGIPTVVPPCRRRTSWQVSGDIVTKKIFNSRLFADIVE